MGLKQVDALKHQNAACKIKNICSRNKNLIHIVFDINMLASLAELVSAPLHDRETLKQVQGDELLTGQLCKV